MGVRNLSRRARKKLAEIMVCRLEHQAASASSARMRSSTNEKSHPRVGDRGGRGRVTQCSAPAPERVGQVPAPAGKRARQAARRSQRILSLRRWWICHERNDIRLASHPQSWTVTAQRLGEDELFRPDRPRTSLSREARETYYLKLNTIITGISAYPHQCSDPCVHRSVRRCGVRHCTGASGAQFIKAQWFFLTRKNRYLNSCNRVDSH